MNIVDIHITSYPCVIISDSHTNLTNIKVLKSLYPNSQFISLGDFTFLFAKSGEKFNEHSIQYFIDNKIPALEGNHESYISASEHDDKFVTQRVLGNPPNFNLSKEHLEFIDKLPRGFRLILPSGKNYYCFHNEPFDLWGFPDKIDQQYLKDKYAFDADTIGIIQGHLHLNKIDNLTPKRYVIGQLCYSNHHTGEKTGGNYLILSEKGLEYKKV